MIIAINGRVGSGKDTIGSIIQYLTGINYENSGIPYKFLVGVDYSSMSKWQIRKFADRLKDIICLLTGCTREQLEDQKFKNRELDHEWWYYKLSNTKIVPRFYFPTLADNQMAEERYLVKPTYRILLQQIGTDLFRDRLHQNVWVNSLMSQYKLEDTDDVHFPIVDGRQVKTRVQKHPNWIITDMRFPNELKAVKDRKGITIRVTRNIEFNLNDYETAYEYGKNILKEKYGIETSEYPDEVSIKDDSNLYTKDGLKEEYCKEFNDLVNSYVKPVSKEHESETALDDATFDYEIDNSSTIKELIEKVRVILIKEKVI